LHAHRQLNYPKDERNEAMKGTKLGMLTFEPIIKVVQL